MNIDTSFPSKYLKAADLQGRQVPVQISGCQVEKLGDGAEAESKPVLYFSGKAKGLVLNRTNATAIADVFGPETDQWAGAAIILFPMKVLFQGKMVDSIRVSIPAAPPAAVPVLQPRSAAVLYNQQVPGRIDQPVAFSELNPPPVSDSDVPF